MATPPPQQQLPKDQDPREYIRYVPCCLPFPHPCIAVSWCWFPAFTSVIVRSFVVGFVLFWRGYRFALSRGVVGDMKGSNGSCRGPICDESQLHQPASQPASVDARIRVLLRVADSRAEQSKPQSPPSLRDCCRDKPQQPVAASSPYCCLFVFIIVAITHEHCTSRISISSSHLLFISLPFMQWLGRRHR